MDRGHASFECFDAVPAEVERLAVVIDRAVRGLPMAALIAAWVEARAAVCVALAAPHGSVLDANLLGTQSQTSSSIWCPKIALHR